MKASDVMTRRVISVRPESPVLEAIQLMVKHRISGLPVLDDRGMIVGIVTEGDFLRRHEIGTERRRPHWLELLIGPGRLAQEYVHSRGRKVAEVMTRDVVSVTEDAPLHEIVRLMERHRFKRVPVLSLGRIVGIITRANLLQAMVVIAQGDAPAPETDRAIRDRLLAEIDREPWGPRGSINIAVRDGVVDLWGTIADERERAALHVMAENVAGVKHVRDHVVLLEPISGTMIDAVQEPQKELFVPPLP